MFMIFRICVFLNHSFWLTVEQEGYERHSRCHEESKKISKNEKWQEDCVYLYQVNKSELKTLFTNLFAHILVVTPEGSIHTRCSGTGLVSYSSAVPPHLHHKASKMQKVSGVSSSHLCIAVVCMKYLFSSTRCITAHWNSMKCHCVTF